MRRALLLVLVAALAGCAGDDDAATTGAQPPTTATTAEEPATTAGAEETTVRVYFVRGEDVGVAARRIERTRAVAAAAVRELVAGPSADDRAAGLTTAIPRGTRLLGVSIADGVATVDLSREFESGGGSASMQLRVAQVVYTLTQFPTAKRVLFRLDGDSVEAIGGEGVVVSPPVARGNFEEQTPPILVESPAPGATVSSPLRVRGTANTFEATLLLRVVDAAGSELYDDFTTATSGSGTRGTFDVTLEFEVRREGPGTLVAYEQSAEDGSEIHVVRIPIELRR